MDYGDKLRAVEDIYSVMADSDHPFLDYYESFPDKGNPKELMLVIVFAKSNIFYLLMAKS